MKVAIAFMRIRVLLFKKGGSVPNSGPMGPATIADSVFVWLIKLNITVEAKNV